MIKSSTNEMSYLWDRKDLKENKKGTKIIVEADRNQRNKLAKRLGVEKLKSFKTKFEVFQVEKDLIQLNANISSQIEVMDPNTGDINEIYVNENFEEKLQFCSSEDQELNPIIEDKLITERFDGDLIDLGEIAAQNLCLAVDIIAISTLSEGSNKDASISSNTISAKHRPFSELGALIEMQTESKDKI